MSLHAITNISLIRTARLQIFKVFQRHENKHTRMREGLKRYIEKICALHINSHYSNQPCTYDDDLHCKRYYKAFKLNIMTYMPRIKAVIAKYLGID